MHWKHFSQEKVKIEKNKEQYDDGFYESSIRDPDGNIIELAFKELPGYVQREFEEFLQCGRLEHGFLRVRCESCHAEHLVAFSCKRRGFCPSCGARRMAESAALLVDEVLPEQPMRQWVLSFPFQLRFLFGVVCGKGRNPTLRLWPAIFSGEIDVFPGDRRSRLISSMTSVAPA
jgi:ribosomal protein S27E